MNKWINKLSAPSLLESLLTSTFIEKLLHEGRLPGEGLWALLCTNKQVYY